MKSVEQIRDKIAEAQQILNKYANGGEYWRIKHRRLINECDYWTEALRWVIDE